MRKELLESGAVSAFCESVAIMLSAGIQTDEAVHMLGDKMQDATFKQVCSQVYASLLEGNNLAEAMEATGAFPAHAINMVKTGEQTGRTESVLRGLAVYYDEESRLFAKMQSSIAYPAALLCVMSIILLFTVLAILPVFMDTYESFAGTLTSGSFISVNVALIIGWVALIVTLVVTIVALTAAVRCRSVRGRARVLKSLNKFPATKQAMYQISLSRFTSALSTLVASGIDSNDAMSQAMENVDNDTLYHKLEPAYTSMLDIDNIVPISDFNRGKASVAFKRVSSGVPVVVMKHNKPSYVIVDIDDYRDATEALEDFELYALATERMKHFDPDKCISFDELLKEEGITREELDAMPEVEFE